jgi:hypothetical protein
VIQGDSIEHAVNNQGYGSGALAALDFYENGVCTKYEWNADEKEWDTK